jgi:hypothetical protein
MSNKNDYSNFFKTRPRSNANKETIKAIANTIPQVGAIARGKHALNYASKKPIPNYSSAGSAVPSRIDFAELLFELSKLYNVNHKSNFTSLKNALVKYKKNVNSESLLKEPSLKTYVLPNGRKFPVPPGASNLIPPLKRAVSALVAAKVGFKNANNTNKVEKLIDGLEAFQYALNSANKSPQNKRVTANNFALKLKNLQNRLKALPKGPPLTPEQKQMIKRTLAALSVAELKLNKTNINTFESLLNRAELFANSFYSSTKSHQNRVSNANRFANQLGNVVSKLKKIQQSSPLNRTQMEMLDKVVKSVVFRTLPEQLQGTLRALKIV